MNSINLEMVFNWAKELLSKFHQSLLRQAMAVCLMGISLWLIFMAASSGLADFFAKQARYNMQQWEKQGTLITIETWKLTRTQIARAISFEPAHPDFFELTGQVYYLLYRFGAITPAEKFSALEQALSYYLKATQQRPVSAYTWANIAILKSRLGQYDSQLLKALESATLLGPWEPFVQQAVVEVGLAGWYKFPFDARKKGRQIVFETIERGMDKQATLMSQLIKKHNREWVVCAYHSYSTSKMAEYCS